MRAILCGYYGKGNGGDEALLASLLQMLPDNIQPYVLSGNPSETKQRYQVEAGDRLNTFTILQAMRRSDIFICCLLYTSPSPRDTALSRMPSSA